MDRVFHAFIDTLNGNPDIPSLHSAMGDIVVALDLNCFAYLFESQQADASVKLISNYPTEWTDHYLDKSYQQLDPVIGQASRQSDPFQWGCDRWLPDLGASQLKFLDEAAQFGIRCGVTIPICDPRCRIATLTFAADQSHGRFSRSVERHLSLFRLLAVLFHSRASLRLAPSRCIAGVQLTPREYECLEWAARGKSAWDIGCILGISRRTAAFHLDNARSKLDVKTISQAVAKLAAGTNFLP